MYLARTLVVELPDGTRRAAVTAPLKDVIQAQLKYAEALGRLRILT